MPAGSGLADKVARQLWSLVVLASVATASAAGGAASEPAGTKEASGSSAAADAASADGQAEGETSPPHILILLADDLGWRDVSYHGSEIETPSIDRIARDGIELDRFYVQPTCSPTRAALMTGKSPLRLGILRPISKNETSGLPKGETLLPEQLARLGYQALMVGKWHLGHYTPDLFPQARGFEYFYGHVTGGIGYWDHNHGGGHDWQRNGETLREEGYSTHLIAEDAIRILRSRDPSRPTFLYVAFNAPHLPNEAPASAVEHYAQIEDEKRRTHAGMVSELDRAIGRILEAFEQEGLLEDTIVLFSSDNGGLNHSVYDGTGLGTAFELLVTGFGRPLFQDGLEFLASNVFDGAADNRPLPRGKGTVDEGGVRVPAALWWPGRLEGDRYEGFMTISDVLPTLLEAIGAREAIPDDLDGRSQWAALRGEPSGSATPDYVTHGAPSGMAIYRPPWKLVDPDAPRLYQIYDDPLETTDLAGERPELVEQLVEAARDWPRGEPLAFPLLDILLDPDGFGGAEEDREPWADTARRRAEASR